MLTNIERAKLQLIDETNDMVIITKAEPLDAPNGPEVVWVNKAFENISKYKANEIIGQTPRILQGKETNQNTLKMIKEALKAQTNINVDLLNYTKDGTPYWISFSIVYLRDGQGNLCYLGAIEKDITALKNLNFKLSEKAKTDPLTNVYNQENFFIAGNEAIKNFHQNQEAVGLLFFDVDDFKGINDTQGHIYGDMILKKVAQESLKLVRKTDNVFRYGGDEFAIIFSGIDVKILERKAQQLQKKLAKSHISVSIGGTISIQSDKSINTLLARADEALYYVKANKKGLFFIAE
ncbi:TPA: diguanylate cyclase [Legionella pneumophila]|uniref:Sensory box (GGDEF/EAL domain) n=2 Tax=Legionella pneumophila TaxID=446 RepID=Q5ZZ56_LEGPH|nr:GGDEF domain-containing protein [Legionella pneumophila]AAU26262.1 sensory box (GGDEF/EAL domain) [Legionella pneumophila subsp. pneumophila str. Philadelphia 1]AEW50444.1 sensory box (GGDEF/EAL domain) [Legionella pneumophila subsp. pneumophila ATCC 43290]AGH55167.1 Sensory box/GGDEF domain/EAL domain protein [Legionella pneumophila subsp. pneumophila LPE509]AGN13085.1 sensory box protein [Legionella pneumophila subsp. pneumophila str. Thunder Bay]AOU03314.1 histidine kinase [Legionella pn